MPVGTPELPGVSLRTYDPVLAPARAAIDSTHLADGTTIDALNSIRFTDEGAAAAAEALRAGVTGDALWAATWIYGASGTDPEVLKPLLSSADVTVQAMAAVTLLAWGEREAAPVLGQLLSESGSIRGSEPPVSISGFTAGALDRFVEGPEIATNASPEERGAAWSSWLAANHASMEYDADTARWHAP